MKRISLPVGVAIAAAAIAVAGVPAAASPTSTASPSIVGGSPVTTAPSWTAVVGTSGSDMWCSGTLVAKQWVLTAAHCEGGKVIRIGSKNTTSGGTLANVSKWVRHPKYSTGYDFSLYKLSAPVSNAPATLASSSPASGASVTLYGNGQTCATRGCGDMSSVLKSVGTKVVADSQCGGIQGSVELCFDTSTRATDCYGDSGGPAVVDGKVVGVDSRGADGPGADTCGKTNSIYGDVSTVLDWIRTTTAG